MGAFFFCLSEEMGGIESRSECEANRPNREAGSRKFPSGGEEIICDQFLFQKNSVALATAIEFISLSE